MSSFDNGIGQDPAKYLSESENMMDTGKKQKYSPAKSEVRSNLGEVSLQQIKERMQGFDGSPYDKSIQDILLFNTNKFYINYFDQALFFDFGIVIPLIVVVFSIMYIQLGDHISKPFWNLLIIFLSLNLFFRIDTNSKLIYVAMLNLAKRAP